MAFAFPPQPAALCSTRLCSRLGVSPRLPTPSTFADGSMYDGQFVNNMFHGHGVMDYEDGSQCVPSSQ